MMGTFTIAAEYVEVDCGHESHGPGGFDFAMSRTFYDETQRTKRTWYCPMGHPRAWRGKTTEQSLKDARAKATHLQDQLRAAVRDAEASRVQLLRDRARFANGVCPCCNRFFDNVHRHMSSKHPDYTPAAKAPVFRCSCGREFTTFPGLRTHQGKSRNDTWDAPTASRWSSHLTKV